MPKSKLLSLILLAAISALCAGCLDSGNYGGQDMGDEASRIPYSYTAEKGPQIKDNDAKDPRCHLFMPETTGDCQTVIGAYYDKETGLCHNIRGCEALGTIPFDSKFGDALRQCLDICARFEDIAEKSM